MLEMHNKTYILDLKDIAKCSVVYHLFDNLCYKIANIIYTRRNTFRNVCDTRAMRRNDLRRRAARHITAMPGCGWHILITLECDASHLSQTWPSDSASESERQFMPSERQTDFGAAYGSTGKLKL